MSGIGVITLCLGVKMFLPSKNILAVIGAMVLGGVLGTALGFQHGLIALSEYVKTTLHGGGKFTEAIVTTSVLYCVGPMTLLGCIQDGVEGNIELLKVKSALDGVGSVFFAASLGPGVLVTAVILLVFQGSLTLAARWLRRFAQDSELVAEATAAGGAMMVMTGLGLLGIKSLPVADYLPALVLAPTLGRIMEKWENRTK
jgi:hypothetical protein